MLSRGAPLGSSMRQKKVLGLVAGFFGYNYCFYLLLLWFPTYFAGLKLDPGTPSFIQASHGW